MLGRRGSSKSISSAATARTSLGRLSYAVTIRLYSVAVGLQTNHLGWPHVCGTPSSKAVASPRFPRLDRELEKPRRLSSAEDRAKLGPSTRFLDWLRRRLRATLA